MIGSKIGRRTVMGATATVSAVQGVTVGAETGGRVSEILFESGATVSQGDVLLRLDTASEDARLAAAQAAAETILRDFPGHVDPLIRRWLGERTEYGMV